MALKRILSVIGHGLYYWQSDYVDKNGYLKKKKDGGNWGAINKALLLGGFFVFAYEGVVDPPRGSILSLLMLPIWFGPTCILLYFEIKDAIMEAFFREYPEYAIPITRTIKGVIIFVIAGGISGYCYFTDSHYIGVTIRPSEWIWEALPDMFFLNGMGTCFVASLLGLGWAIMHLNGMASRLSNWPLLLPPPSAMPIYRG